MPMLSSCSPEIWIDEKLLTAKGVYGLFAACSIGDDIEVYADASKKAVLATIHTLRQQGEKPQGQPNLALADYVAPQSSGRTDHVGRFCRHRRACGWMSFAVGSIRITTITIRSWPKRWQTVWPRRSPNTSTNESGSEWRYGKAGAVDQRRSDPGKVSGHSACARISGLSGPYRKADALRPVTG